MPRRASAALAFDLDGPTGAAMLDGSLWRKPEYFTFGGYGPYRALPRLLDLLAPDAVISGDALAVADGNVPDLPGGTQRAALDAALEGGRLTLRRRIGP